jgi:hypothetical protein
LVIASPASPTKEIAMTNSIRSTRIRSAVVGTLALGVLGTGLTLAPGALASHGGNAVRHTGSCSGAGTWALKAKPDAGILQVEAEVDVNRVGRTFHWTISDNGHQVRSGTATTKAPSGSFTVNRRIANRAGVDKVVFRAKSASGNTCTGTVSV